LKLKQFIRSNNSNHVICKLQKISLEKIGYDSVINQEYSNICKEDEIIRESQIAINLITDQARKEKYGKDDNGLSSTIAINEVGSINIPIYLRRKKKVLELCVFNTLREEGITHLSDLLEEMEFSNDAKRDKILKFIESTIPIELLEIAQNFNNNINVEQLSPTHFYLGDDYFTNINSVTVKQLQKRLKIAMNKVTTIDYNVKNGIENFETDDIIIIRKNIKNVKLRNIFYRLINNDFYNKVKMKKFKITPDDLCDRCGLVETTKHLLWECKWSNDMWSNLNSIYRKLGIKECSINKYDDLFKFDYCSGSTTIKLKLINELIQIERPKHLNVQNISIIINKLKNMEKYIAIKNKQLPKYYEKWRKFETL